MRVRIDGEMYEVRKVYDGGYLPLVAMMDNTEWYMAESSEDAGQKARDYWEELKDHDPKEFVCLVGEQNIISWALGHYAGPGSTPVNSLEDWLDLWYNTPEENWASYDSAECEVTRIGQLAKELGFIPTVAYRHN